MKTLNELKHDRLELIKKLSTLHGFNSLEVNKDIDNKMQIIGERIKKLDSLIELELSNIDESIEILDLLMWGNNG